jgi:transposase-like protein
MGDRQLWNNQINKAQKYTVADFNTEFPDDDSCLEYIKEQRFPGGITHCDKCGTERKHYRVKGRTAYACDHCGHHIYPLAGTIFEKSTTSLKMWFHAMFQMGSTKCGISAKQIQRETGVTYKTAWRMFKQIRTLMSEEISLEGEAVEMDETYFGGERRGRRADGKFQTGRPPVGDKKKTPIVGIVQREGRVVARATKDVKSSTLLGMVREYVLPKSTVYTDELKAYGGIEALRDKGDSTKSAGYEHRRINHSAGVYVMGNVHTNTVEGFWSLIKRGIGGTHRAVSQKFLQSYLDEYGFRYNRRDVARPMFKLILEKVSERAE